MNQTRAKGWVKIMLTAQSTGADKRHDISTGVININDGGIKLWWTMPLQLNGTESELMCLIWICFSCYNQSKDLFSLRHGGSFYCLCSGHNWVISYKLTSGLQVTVSLAKNCLYFTGLCQNLSWISKRPWWNLRTCIHLNSCCWLGTMIKLITRTKNLSVSKLWFSVVLM